MVLLKIGDFDLTPYIEEDGYRYERNSLDAEGSGRTMDGKMHISRISLKIKLQITCMDLDDATCRKILVALHPKYVTATVYDPEYGEIVKELYSNSPKVKTHVVTKNGEISWSGLSFSLIEV